MTQKRHWNDTETRAWQEIWLPAIIVIIIIVIIIVLVVIIDDDDDNNILHLL